LLAEDRDKKFIDRLEEEGKKRELPPRLLEFYQRLLTIQSRGEQLIGKINPVLSEETINERLDNGMPLISFDELTLDWSLLNKLFTQVTTIFTDYYDLFDELPQSSGQPKLPNSLSRRVVKAWFKKDSPSSIISIENNKYLLLEVIIHATLKPFLVCHAKTLIGSVNQERWRREYCPVCGGKPDLAFLDTERGARWLLCSRCDSEWLFQRLQCPYCNTDNQKDLSYFTDDEGIYRLYVCEQCHKYIKAIDLRAAKPEVLLPLERLLTLDMDRQAQEKGYLPGCY
jgi:FdhE protein